MGPGLFAPGRIDQSESGEAHSQAHQGAMNEFSRDSADGWSSGVVEENGEEAGGDHEDGKLGGFHQILRPVIL